MQTTFFNVGHGEAIFIELNNGRGIVRDFGRSRSARHTSTCCLPATLLNCCHHTRKHYIPLIRSRRLDAVLSHAHEDHFNGFKMMHDMGWINIFENTYIPWFSMKDLNSFGGVLIKYSLLLYRCYSPSSLIATNAKHWLLAVPVMAYISRRLWSVSSGYCVQEWGVNQFLWPPAPPQRYEEKLKQKLDAYLSQNVSNSLSLEFLHWDAQQVLDVLKEFYPSSPESQNGSEISSEQASTAIQTITSVLDQEEGRKLATRLPSPKSLSTIYKHTLDNHGLIFEIGEGCKKSLFLSDADDPTVGRMLKANKINDRHYQLIKSGHHGNRGAKKLRKHNVTSKVVVNCCGPSNNSYKGPDHEYCNVSTGDVICTDWNYNGSKWNGKALYKIPTTCRITL